jgi:hypothetical protein
VIEEFLGRAMFGGQRAVNLIVTNVRASATTLYTFGAPMREVRPYVPLCAGHRIGIAVVVRRRARVGPRRRPHDTPDLAILVEGVRGLVRGAPSRRATAA